MIRFLAFTILFISQIALSYYGDPKYEILDMEISNNLPFVKLKIEDQEAKFMLDTGARNQVLVLDKNIIAKLNSIVPFSVKEKSSDITGKEYIAKKYILPEFNIGGISFLQLRLVEDTNWGLAVGDRVKKEGVIGLELFINKAIIIDYPQNKLVVIDREMPKEYDCENWHELKFKVDRNGVYIFTSLDGGVERSFILDTGATLSLIKPKSVGLNEVRNDCNISLSFDGKCSYINPDKLKINNMEVNGISFYTYNFPPEFEPDGILGYDFLKDKVLYIDFDKRVIKVNTLP